MRMVYRVHYGTSYCRSYSHVSLSSGLTYAYDFMLKVSYLADSCLAFNPYHSYFTGWKSQLSIVAFLGHKLGCVSCCSNQLTTLAGLKLNIVNKSTNRDVL
ncbi:hypothetical protein SDC9_139541 [bioreactor metagenome]|uniref:Uncharacterized protein n=1 Tax=bioreactor metagenome TaxID=1076179 RepID=A0A645DSV2_9ZZZZ